MQSCDTDSDCMKKNGGDGSPKVNKKSIKAYPEDDKPPTRVKTKKKGK